MTDIGMLDYFLILFARERSHRKKQRQAKCGSIEKNFLIKLVHCFKLMTVSNRLSTFETDRPFCFYTRT